MKRDQQAANEIYDGIEFEELSEIYEKSDEIKKKLGIINWCNLRLKKKKKSFFLKLIFNRGVGCKVESKFNWWV